MFEKMSDFFPRKSYLEIDVRRIVEDQLHTPTREEFLAKIKKFLE
jgi:hypothetical protein